MAPRLPQAEAAGTSVGRVAVQSVHQHNAPFACLATAAYGDGGPGYIPVAKEYAKGGYEVSVDFRDPQVDPILSAAMSSLLS